jgi:hypothetical protein
VVEETQKQQLRKNDAILDLVSTFSAAKIHPLPIQHDDYSSVFDNGRTPDNVAPTKLPTLAI